MLGRILITTATAVLCASVRGQDCAIAFLPFGQPALGGITPRCVGNLPLPLPAGGNPGFAIAAFTPPPIPTGAPVLLVIEAAGPTIALGAGVPLHAPFGTPAILGGTPVATVMAGLSNGSFGAPVPLPIPPNTSHLSVFVQTAVLLPATSSVAIADVLYVTI